MIERLRRWLIEILGGMIPHEIKCESCGKTIQDDERCFITIDGYYLHDRCAGYYE